MADEVISLERMRAIDINSKYLGVPVEDLMENAGRAICSRVIGLLTSKERSVLIVSGPGNNGGDGLVAARYLISEGIPTRVVLLRESMNTRESRKNLDRLMEISPESVEIFRGTLDIREEIIIDSILGTGMRGPLREPVRTIVHQINSSKAKKISIDYPTGFSQAGEDYVKPDLIICLHRKKKGLERFPGVVEPIGIPGEAETHTGPGDIIINLEKRERDSHKGNFGRVLVIGGSDLYHGAPILSGLGAFRAGADLVYLAVPESISSIVRNYYPDFIVVPYPGDYLTGNAHMALMKMAEKCQAAVIGPGLGLRERTVMEVKHLVKSLEIPMVLDADAIKAVSPKPHFPKGKAIVATPHKKEFQLLSGSTLEDGVEGRKEQLITLAKKTQCTILLKAATDLTASKEGQLRMNSTGNPGMTVGGTGDVLAGLVGGLLGQGIPAFESASMAAFINGYTGDRLYEKMGYFFMASDLADAIPTALKEILDFR